MKHLAISLKFLCIMGIFGLFTIGMAVYVTGRLDETAHAYDALIKGDSVASLDIATANRAFAEIDASAIGQDNTADWPPALARAGSHIMEFPGRSAKVEP